MLRRQAHAEFHKNILRIQQTTNDIRLTISLTKETIMEAKDSIRRAEEMLKLCRHFEQDR